MKRWRAVLLYLQMTWRRKGATSESSAEWVTYHVLPKPARDSPAATMDKLKAPTEQRCAGGIWRVIRQAESEILYEGKLANCPRDPDEVAIIRILYGQTEMVELVYTARAAELSPAQRQEAITLLMGARFATLPESPSERRQPPALPGGRGGPRRGAGGGM